MRDKRVYIAGPYSMPDPAANTRDAILAAEEITRRTTVWLPFVPHLFLLWNLVSPHSYGFWMRMDQDWMGTCHALVRIGSISAGADNDMNRAIDLGTPVFTGLDEFVTWTEEGKVE